MSCTGCEAVVEAALRQLDGVVYVKASFAENQVTISYAPEKTGFAQMRAAVQKAGYSLERAGEQAQDQSDEERSQPFSTRQFIGIAVILLALYLIIKHTVGFNFIPPVTASMGYGVLFVVGLLTSLHCVAMCGGINMSQCIGSGQAKAGVKEKVRPSLLYNLGRVTSYTLIGGVVGAIGSAVSFSGWAKGLVAIVSGLLMLIMGLSMTGLFPWLNRLTPRLPRVFRDKVGAAGSKKGPYVVGLANGLMPCGPLQAMQIYALGSGSFIAGALAMFVFSLGTLPLMFGLGAVITMLGSKFTKKMMKVSAILVAVLGIIMLGRGLVLSGVAWPAESRAQAASSVAEASAATIVDGVQNVSSSLTSAGYPDITVQQGVPVVWNLQADAGSLNGCNSTLVIDEFDLQVQLQAGDNIIKFTPTESGTITYSCWMGMQTGRINVVDDVAGLTAVTPPDGATAAPAAGGASCCPGGTSAE